jgi:phosphonate transport system substrate-binding protein
MFIFALIAIGSLLFITILPPDKITPSVLRVGVLPDENAAVLRQRYAPLLRYLSESIGIDTQLVLPSTYQELSRLFQDGEVELVYFGGLTFVQASINNAAEPLVIRDIDRSFVSYFLSRSEKVPKHLTDYEGKRFAFGSKLSTSGHLMARHFLATELQIVPESFFSVVSYSGSHDKTAFQVRDGLVDLGVANSTIIKKMILDGRLEEDDLQIVWKTPPYVDYVWAVQKSLDEDIKNKLRDAFLLLDATNSNHNSILTNMGAKSFVPAGIRDFLSLKRTAENLGMLGSSSQ